MIHCAICFHNTGQLYQAAYVALLSCFANTSSPLHVHMVVDDSVKPYHALFEELCAAHGHRLTIHPAPAVPDSVLELFHDGSVGKYTAASLYRLCLHEIIDADKVIYFDCDIVFERDIADLDAIDVERAWMAATHDPERPWSMRKRGYYLKRLGIAEDRYFNSGVLVLNLKKLREVSQSSPDGNVFWTCYRELAARHPNLPYAIYDQDMLNAMLSNDHERLILADASFNYELCLLKRRCLPLDSLRGKILHFPALKPWQKFFPAHMVYWKYFARTPWGGETCERIAERMFDPKDTRMRMLMDIWRSPGPFRWLWALLRRTPLLRG